MAVNNTDRRLAPDVTIDYTEGMTSEPYQPAGYCPHCGYAIDPGTCPECGKTSAAGQLDHVPYWVERKRIIKRATVFAVTLAVLIGGWYFYSRVQWETWLSTSTLLRLQGYGPRRLEGELWGRLRSGTLSPVEQQQMFANYLAETDLLSTRDAYPAGVRIFINRPEMPDSLMFIDAYCQQLIVDGQPVDPSMKRMGDWFGSPEGWVIGPLAPGQHRVTHVMAIAHEWDYRRLDPPPGTVPFATFTTSRTLLIEDKPVTEYARPVWSPELAQEIKQKAKAYVWREGSLRRDIYIALQLESAPVPVAGRLWCDFGEGRMPVLGGVAWRGHKRHIGFGGALTYEHMTRPHPFPEDAPSPRLVDIYLVPDPEIALNSGLTEYFDGVIVWSKCRVEEPVEPKYSTGQVTLKWNTAVQASQPGEVQLPATRPWRDQKRMREKAAEVGLLE